MKPEFIEHAPATRKPNFIVLLLVFLFLMFAMSPVNHSIKKQNEVIACL